MKFYVMKVSLTAPNAMWFSKMEPVLRADAWRCPSCDEVVSSLPWLPPYRAELTIYGKLAADVAGGPGDELLVSARFRAAWEQEQLCGLVFEPLDRLRVRPARFGRKPLTYFVVKPPRLTTRTQVDVERSLIEYDRPITCKKCKSGGIDTIRGFTIDEASWSGEDMFHAWGSQGLVIVTDRVRQLRDEFGLTNVELTPTEKHVWDPLYRWTPVDYSRDEVPASDEDDQQNTSMTN